ncbi:MAG TPA: ATP-binding protein [Myxococcota bacterium]|nr:ATP-binding protein [Myxococcota bacterium]
MEDAAIRTERAHNLWTSFARKFDAIARSTDFDPNPQLPLSEIGGLAAAKEEILTYACGVTDPAVYSRWGTYPPSGLLLIGRRGVGKRLLAMSLATLTRSCFIAMGVPRLVIEVIHEGGKVGDLVAAWSQILSELPKSTILFNELEFSQAQEIGARRPDLPIGPVMDFLLDLIDRTVAADAHLVVGSTNHPDTLRQAFVQPGRFERVVEVTPAYPGDIVEALEIHARASEKRAGHALFDDVDWKSVVERYRDPSTGDWIRIMHGALRRKARCEASGEVADRITTRDLLDEVDRFRQTNNQIALPLSGNYV